MGLEASCDKCKLEIKETHYNQIRYMGKTVVGGYGFIGIPWVKVLCDKCLDEIEILLGKKGDDNG
jgi:hypothetical protein